MADGAGWIWMRVPGGVAGARTDALEVGAVSVDGLLYLSAGEAGGEVDVEAAVFPARGEFA